MKNVKKAALDPREYVKFWFAATNKTARGAARIPSTLATISLDYINFFKQFQFKHQDLKVKPFTQASLEFALQEYIELNLKEEVDNALKGFECETENLQPLRNWVKAVTGKEDANDIAIMAHWIWMIKRKGYNKSVKYHIMPVLYGPQGGGKTVAIEKLIQPIHDYRLAIGMNQLSDERVFEGLASNYVVVFDELQGIERADMNSLKKQITTTYNSFRKLYTTFVISVEMKCSFIGATNKPMAESFSDSTGMRRFWEMVTLTKLNWALLGSIDFKELWKGVDERLEDGYLKGDVLTTVTTEQQQHVNKDDIEEFIIQELVKPADGGNVSEMDAQSLYNHYYTWAGKNGINKQPANWFTRKLKRRLNWRSTTDDKGRPIYKFVVNSNSPLISGTH